MARGTEDNFLVLMQHLSSNAKKYELGEIKFVQYATNIDNYFANLGWSRSEFEKELRRRLIKVK